MLVQFMVAEVQCSVPRTGSTRTLRPDNFRPTTPRSLEGVGPQARRFLDKVLAGVHAISSKSKLNQPEHLQHSSSIRPSAKMPHPYETKEEILKLGKIDPELDEASESYVPRKNIILNSVT